MAGISELDKARAEASIMELEESIKKGHLSAQQVKLLETAQSDIPFGYDPNQTSPEAVNLVTMYHNQTGAPHPTPEYMIRNFLTRRFPRENWVPQSLWGKAVYSLVNNFLYHEPTIMCWLDASSPRKADFEALGIFQACEKGSGFNNEFEVETHMHSAHRRFMQAYETSESRKQQQEMIDLQRALLKSQQDQVERQMAADDKAVLLNTKLVKE